MIAKCPKCDTTIQSFSIVGVSGSAFMAQQWKCIALCCPHCQATLGAQIDPIAIKTDILSELVDLLRK